MPHDNETANIVEVERNYTVENQNHARSLFGTQDEHLKMVEKAFGVNLVTRGDEIQIRGPENEVTQVEELFHRLADLLSNGVWVTPNEVGYGIKLVKAGDDTNLSDIFSDVISVTARGKPIRPKTLGQKRYVDAMRENGIVFSIGPAGTGKTYLAMAMAVKAFKEKEVNRIILTRPAVEAGEKLGFLPGDLQEKVDPYLRPLYDAMYDILGVDTYRKHMERGLIEVAPLAYMRGRTLDDSFIILDEAQNTTPEQMKMFLTRLGFSSKAVVTGDITQVDLPEGKFSGLQQVQQVLKGVPGIGFIHLTDRDVVRHRLVQAVIKAYERWDNRKGKGDSSG